AASFQRVVAAPRARVPDDQTSACPTFELLDRNAMQSLRAGTNTCQRCFRIDATNLAGQRNHATCQRRGALSIISRRDVLKESWTGANERDESGVSVRRNRPKQIDPIIETFRQRSQHVAAG